ncbi:MAG: 30S ribosome-binding factor RbfA [Alphaproteobacteria bacterium]|jgi:ribosome-binding factor A|nr:30S ribosome-binding factor RbfA [Alphaproteobacteria bacterium]
MARRASKDRNGKPPTQRQLRVGEEIRHALSAIMLRAEFRDPDLVGRVITVTEVRISPDLRNATAFVLPLEGDAEPMVEALQRASAYLRGQLARMVKLRYLPALHFVHDESFDEATRIDRIMHSPEFTSGLEDDEPDADAEAGSETDAS